MDTQTVKIAVICKKGLHSFRFSFSFFRVFMTEEGGR